MSDRGLSSTIHQLNIISLLLQSFDEYTYEVGVNGLQTPKQTVVFKWEGEQTWKMRREGGEGVGGGG